MKRFIWESVNVPVCSLIKNWSRRATPHWKLILPVPASPDFLSPVTSATFIHDIYLVGGYYLVAYIFLFLIIHPFFWLQEHEASPGTPHSSLLCQRLTALVALCNINSGNWGHPSLCLLMFVLCCSPVSPGGQWCTNVSFFGQTDSSDNFQSLAGSHGPGLLRHSVPVSLSLPLF